jgi:hypothetical protein
VRLRRPADSGGRLPVPRPATLRLAIVVAVTAIPAAAPALTVAVPGLVALHESAAIASPVAMINVLGFMVPSLFTMRDGKAWATPEHPRIRREIASVCGGNGEPKDKCSGRLRPDEDTLASSPGDVVTIPEQSG